MGVSLHGGRQMLCPRACGWQQAYGVWASMTHAEPDPSAVVSAVARSVSIVVKYT